MVCFTHLQIGPSRSSSCNEFPIAASFSLSAAAFTSEEPPKSSEACSPGWSVQAEGHVARSPGSSITQAFWGLLQKLWQETWNIGACFSGLTPQSSLSWELSGKLFSLWCQLTRKWHCPTSWVRWGRAQNGSWVSHHASKDFPATVGDFYCN